jgi:ATP-dependent RNA helicase DeaD
VGAIVGEAKIAADRIGKIEVRELYSLVEVCAEDAERIVVALTGATMRGRRLTAHVDRGAGPARPPRRG